MAYNPYNNYMNPQFNPYYQQQYQQPNYQQPQMPVYQQPMQSGNQPAFVSGIEGAKAYILMPNQTIWLKDSDNENILYIKTADMQGKCTLNAYTINQIPLDNVGKHIDSKKEESVVPQYDFSTFATKDDLKAFLNDFNSKMDNLSGSIEKLNKQGIKQVKTNNYKRGD